MKNILKKSFVTRTLTSIVFVIVLLGSAIISPITLLVLFALIITKGLLEYYRMVLNAGFKPQIITGSVLGILVLISNYSIASGYTKPSLSIFYVLIVVLITIVELYRDTEAPFTNIAHTLFAVLYISTPFSLTNYLVYSDLYNAEYNPYILISLFVLIWSSDAGAYIVGSTIGKHKLFPKISPKKTWEGTIGGGVVTIISSIIISHFILEISTLHWIVIAILTVIFGTFGDLTESLIKRKINIKDSGNVLPGHGGVLDRFDSLLMVAPIVLLYITFFVE